MGSCCTEPPQRGKAEEDFRTPNALRSHNVGVDGLMSYISYARKAEEDFRTPNALRSHNVGARWAHVVHELRKKSGRGLPHSKRVAKLYVKLENVCRGIFLS